MILVAVAAVLGNISCGFHGICMLFVSRLIRTEDWHTCGIADGISRLFGDSRIDFL